MISVPSGFSFKKVGAAILGTAALTLGVGLLSSQLETPAHATASAAITQFQEDITAAGSVATAVAPVAVGSIAFCGGALIVKRIIFA